MSTWTHERARVASLTRSRPADDPELVAARRNLRAARLADHIETALADAPALTQEQRDSIARLLTDRPAAGAPPGCAVTPSAFPGANRAEATEADAPEAGGPDAA